MQPVGLNSLVGSANHAANIVGVVIARVEISVIANEHGHGHLDACNREAEFLHCFSFVRISIREQMLETGAYFQTQSFAVSSKNVQFLMSVEHFVFAKGREKRTIKFASLFHLAKVHQVVTNASNTDFVVMFGAVSYTIRNVL